MKRRTRLKAKTRLERRTPLRSGGSAIKQGAPIRQQSAKTRTRRRTWPKLREAVLARAGSCCDFCAYAISGEWECHHRKKRSQGGHDEMSNLLALHSACHHDSVHGRPAWAYEHGFLVRRDDDPAGRRVFRHQSRWQLPGETWTPADSEEIAA